MKSYVLATDTGINFILLLFFNLTWKGVLFENSSYPFALQLFSLISEIICYMRRYVCIYSHMYLIDIYLINICMLMIKW